MRLIKMLGLAAVAAVAAMAFVGASSAMAGSTLLCSNNTESLTPDLAECKPPGTIGFLSVEEVKDPTKDAKGTLLNEDLDVKCNALLTGKVLPTATHLIEKEEKEEEVVLSYLTSNGPVVIHVAKAELTYTGCTFPCTATSLKDGVILVLKTGPELAEITAHNFVVRVNCIGIIDCDYDATNLTGHGLGAAVLGTGGKGHVTYSKNLVNIKEELGSVGCPPTGLLDALFQSKTPLYIRS